VLFFISSFIVFVLSRYSSFVFIKSIKWRFSYLGFFGVSSVIKTLYVFII